MHFELCRYVQTFVSVCRKPFLHTTSVNHFTQSLLSRYREKRYQATLAACSLVSDLAILEDGDRTEIGEKVSYSRRPLRFPFTH